VDASRYLLCNVGPYTIAIDTDAVSHIGDPDSAKQNVDLRSLLNTQRNVSGVSVAVQVEGVENFLIVDSAARMETIAPGDFLPLPGIFAEASTLFDGAARCGFGSQYPLRLRLQALEPL
jgi:hypothetical protein